MKKSLFRKRTSIEQVEESTELAPKFDSDGLIAAVATDADTGGVLMLAQMNADALEQTIRTGEAHYWSRSRQALWRKGETSGLIQHVVDMLIDDDQDAVWLKVKVGGAGASCHVGYKSCFYRAVPTGKNAGNQLRFTETEKLFNPAEVYADAPNPTRL